MTHAERLQNVFRIGPAGDMDSFRRSLDMFDPVILACNMEDRPFGKVAAVLFVDGSGAVLEIHMETNDPRIKIVIGTPEQIEEAIRDV